MKDILGDVLGSNFKVISLKKYNKALKQVEDKEDYEGAKNALKEDKDANLGLMDDNLVKVDEAVDVDTLVTALPLIYRYGLGMIAGFYTNGEVFNDAQSETQSKQESLDLDDEEEEEVQEGTTYQMNDPKPLSRESALSVMKDEHFKYLNETLYYNFKN